eukprot:TRINITY_DN2249_c0_g1_i8.p1 TRINITY_DN2249_c0_g1~~TRINITY_DN2249_c0_g1_i8.p1  ORF type:complete len:297 (+),score=67.02 TRINITY_DN2249_c0_g1_i8:712-1602(+)
MEFKQLFHVGLSDPTYVDKELFSLWLRGVGEEDALQVRIANESEFDSMFSTDFVGYIPGEETEFSHGEEGSSTMLSSNTIVSPGKRKQLRGSNSVGDLKTRMDDEGKGSLSLGLKKNSVSLTHSSSLSSIGFVGGYEDDALLKNWMLGEEGDKMREQLLMDDTVDQFRLFEQMEQYLAEPTNFRYQTSFVMDDSEWKGLCALYFDFDDQVYRYFIGKKINNRLRKDLEDISEDTAIPLRACQRQFDNLRLLYKTYDDLENPGICSRDIQALFDLSKDQCRRYCCKPNCCNMPPRPL